MAAIAVLIGGAWHTPAYADSGASARNQAVAPAPDDSGATDATPQYYALRILQTLADDHTNNWVRYWQARADCDAAAAYARRSDSPPIDRVLLTLTAAICARIDARLGVNPDVHMPRGEERTVGLVASEPGAAMGYTLFMRRWENDVFLLDPLGRVAYAWHLDVSTDHAKLLDNGNLLAHLEDSATEFDPRGNVVWRYESTRAHHDFLKMPNGNVMLLVQGRKTREEAVAAGANPEFVHESGLLYDYLLEARPAGASGGNVVWEWSPWDHLVQDFDPSKPNYGAIAGHPELIDINFLLESISNRNPSNWLHANAIDYNPELDQIMLSPRHFSELWIIDHSADTEEARGHSGGNSGMGGDLLYRWGNPRVYGHGDVGDQRMFWQHQTHWIPPGLPGAGNILLFNNGWEFPGHKRFYSSIDELVPPALDYGYRRTEGSAYPPNGLEWTYVAETPTDFYAAYASGVQRLPNGNTLVVHGPAGTIFQVTPDGETVWKYVVPLLRRARMRQWYQASADGDPEIFHTNDMYRAYWYPPDHPGLQALDLTPGAYLATLPDIYDLARDAVIAGNLGDRLAVSDFDIYLDEGNRNLIYSKQPCAAADTQARFFLHIIPADARDLPADRQEHGFDNLDFNFDGREVIASDGHCVALRDLPGYAIDRIRTGQFTGEGQLWRADIELSE